MVALVWALREARARAGGAGNKVAKRSGTGQFMSKFRWLVST